MQQAGSWAQGLKHASTGFESPVSKPALQSWKAPKEACCQNIQEGHFSSISAASSLLPGTQLRTTLANPASVCLIEYPH